MKMRFNNKYIKWGFTAFSVIAAGVLLVYLIFNASEFIANIKKIFSISMPVAVGFVIAYLLTPVVNFLEKNILYPLWQKMKIKKSQTQKKIIRGIAIFLTMIVVILIIYILIAMLVSQIVPSIQNIINNFDGYVQNVSNWLNKLPVENKDLYSVITTAFARMTVELENWLDDTANIMNRSSEILKTVSLSVISFVSVLWDVIIGFIISIYVLSSKETFVAQAKKIVYAAFDNQTANSIVDSMRFTHRTFSGFISGKILDSLIIGILCFVGTTLMGTPYASLVSVIVGITNIVPFFGPYLGAIPSAVLILVVDLAHPLNCLYFLIFILVLQQFDGNILGPKILGNSTGLSGFWVIFSITVFGGLFGIMGMIIGVPTFAVIYAAVRGIVNSSLRKKEMPTDTDVYLHVDLVDEDGFHEIQPVSKKRSSTEESKSHFCKVAGMIGRKLRRENHGKNTDVPCDNSEGSEESDKSEKTEEDSIVK